MLAEEDRKRVHGFRNVEDTSDDSEEQEHQPHDEGWRSDHQPIVESFTAQVEVVEPCCQDIQRAHDEHADGPRQPCPKLKQKKM